MITTLQIQEWCKDDAAPRQSELHNQLEYIFIDNKAVLQGMMLAKLGVQKSSIPRAGKGVIAMKKKGWRLHRGV